MLLVLFALTLASNMGGAEASITAESIGNWFTNAIKSFFLVIWISTLTIALNKLLNLEGHEEFPELPPIMWYLIGIMAAGPFPYFTVPIILIAWFGIMKMQD